MNMLASVRTEASFLFVIIPIWVYSWKSLALLSGGYNMAIIHAKTEEEIFKHVDGDKAIVLNFWASWCGPCQMFANVLNEVDEDYADKVQVIKVNVDEAQELAGAFQVQGIPHSRIIIGNGMTDPITGFVPYGQMQQILDEVLQSE